MELEITKGKWTFCVVDTILPPYECPKPESIYKFKRSGKCVQTGFSMMMYGKKITKLKGRWELNGNTLVIIPNDSDRVQIHAKNMKITLVDANIFYSPQPDLKTVYWLFRRE